MVELSLNIAANLNEDSVVVQIGAFDGVSNDDFFLNQLTEDVLYSKIILIEPVEEYYEDLINNVRRENIFFENIGISDVDGYESFYINGQDTSIVRTSNTEVRKIKCHKFDYIIDKYQLTEIDFLLIDVEGYEYVILKSIMENKNILIKNIRYEFWHLTDEDKENLDSLLRYNGYEIYQDDNSYADKLAIKKI
jgi:FkbM family methyltransferase